MSWPLFVSTWTSRVRSQIAISTSLPVWKASSTGLNLNLDKFSHGRLYFSTCVEWQDHAKDLHRISYVLTPWLTITTSRFLSFVRVSFSPEVQKYLHIHPKVTMQSLDFCWITGVFWLSSYTSGACSHNWQFMPTTWKKWGGG